MGIEYKIEIVAQKWQTERYEYEWKYEELIPYSHFLVLGEASASGYKKESENVLVQKI